jgi:hydrogenase expression/formation protein HypC
MCIGIPMRIVDPGVGSALAERGGVRVRLDTMLVDPPRAGEFVLAFQGRAVRLLSDDEAAQIDAALEAMERVLRGSDGIDALFADLDRAPLLPPHLRGA